MATTALRGKGDPVTSRDIACRCLCLYQVVCRVGQKCCLCSAVAVHFERAHARVAHALEDIECCPVKLIGVVSAGNDGVRGLLLERNGDRWQYVEHVLTLAAARHGSQIAPRAVRSGFDASRFRIVVKPPCGSHNLIVGGKMPAFCLALSCCIGVSAVGMGGAVEHPYGKLSGSAGAIGRQVVTAKRRGRRISVTNNRRELVVEPYPALVKVEPWATRLGGTGTFLVHTVRD